MSEDQQITRRCFICSPYSGTKEEIIVNVKRALYACVYTTEVLYLAPYAPHLINTQFLKDDEEGKKKGIELGFVYLNGCQFFLIVGNFITDGMSKEIQEASKKGLNILHVSQKTLDTFIEENDITFKNCLVALPS